MTICDAPCASAQDSNASSRIGLRECGSAQAGRPAARPPPRPPGGQRYRLPERRRGASGLRGRPIRAVPTSRTPRAGTTSGDRSSSLQQQDRGRAGDRACRCPGSAGARARAGRRAARLPPRGRAGGSGRRYGVDVVGPGEVGLAGVCSPPTQRQLSVFEAGSPSSRWRRKKSAPSSQGRRRVKIQIEANHIRACCAGSWSRPARAPSRRSPRSPVVPEQAASHWRRSPSSNPEPVQRGVEALPVARPDRGPLLQPALPVAAPADLLHEFLGWPPRHAPARPPRSPRSRSRSGGAAKARGRETVTPFPEHLCFCFPHSAARPAARRPPAVPDPPPASDRSCPSSPCPWFFGRELASAAALQAAITGGRPLQPPSGATKTLGTIHNSEPFSPEAGRDERPDRYLHEHPWCPWLSNRPAGASGPMTSTRGCSRSGSSSWRDRCMTACPR